jgi:hypothetical protein
LTGKKEKDKATACHEKQYHTVTFALQAVLPTCTTNANLAVTT